MYISILSLSLSTCNGIAMISLTLRNIHLNIYALFSITSYDEIKCMDILKCMEALK